MNFQTFKQQFFTGRYFSLIWLSGFFLLASTATRLILYFQNMHDVSEIPGSFIRIVSTGLFYDVVTCAYTFGLFALYLFVLPQRIFQSAWHRAFLTVASFATVFTLLYLGVVEYFFFDEFNSRFNFVAVSYLIYPHEVFINIWDSYPVGWALTLTTLISVSLFYYFRKPLQASFKTQSRYSERILPFIALVAFQASAYAMVDVETGAQSDNRIANELGQNGIYAFFYAATHNELNYNLYYETIAEQDAETELRKAVYQPNAHFFKSSTNPIARHIDNTNGPVKPLNVVVLVQESLGADYVGAYGDQRGLTPNIDALAQEGMLFTDMYATGTRTVRGLEAITTSFPPIPGESIVKRPGHNEHIFNWGNIMHQNGYTPMFIYGGYGTFDDMNYFYSNNGFEIEDRVNIENPKFSNIWGVSDEDLFKHTLKVFDRKHAAKEKIFAIVMSTSNHKPFTFPEGIPGVAAEGGGREAGIRYADYALGRFFDEVKTKPYFDDTVFIIVGDHGARVYGKEEIPLRSYEIPLLIYAPKYVKPQQVDILTSQIDIAPTVLGMLNISYDSVFFGTDVFHTYPDHKFALVSHNRDVALYDNVELNELGIQKSQASFKYDKPANQQTRIPDDTPKIKTAISIYQEAYNLFMNDRYHL